MGWIQFFKRLFQSKPATQRRNVRASEAGRADGAGGWEGTPYKSGSSKQTAHADDSGDGGWGDFGGDGGGGDGGGD